MPLTPPIHFQKWIDDHRHLLKPPVANKVIWEDGDFIAMVVGGPNKRTDYHYDEGPEFFHQIEGEMVLKIVENGEFRDIPIKAGEVFLLPPKVLHSPQRMAGSIGLVIELKDRPKDGLVWFCDSCGTKLYEEYFKLTNIETQFPPIFEKYYSSQDLRTCKNCGRIQEAPKPKQ